MYLAFSGVRRFRRLEETAEILRVGIVGEYVDDYPVRIDDCVFMHLQHDVQRFYIFQYESV